MRTSALAAAVGIAVVMAIPPMTAIAEPSSTGPEQTFVVLLKGSEPDAAATRAIARAGGTVIEVNRTIGYVYVTSRNARFATAVADGGAVVGAAAERVIGSTPSLRIEGKDLAHLPTQLKQVTPDPIVRRSRSATAQDGVIAPEPLADLQWDMRMIGATPTGSYAVNQGRGVTVGIIGTGVDATHPDIAANLDLSLSRNFVTDQPDIDGPCEVPSCVDPVGVDDNGFSTAAASVITAPINGLGIAGVAPQATLVSIRAGQDSGYAFLRPSLEAITYAADIGVDVINMGFYIDPWLFNCVDNPADSPAEQREQRVIRQAMQRAIDYATQRGVLPIAALGDAAIDLGHPTVDDTSPDFPPGSARTRQIDNSCISVPAELRGVVGVSALGPSKRKSYISSYGVEQTDVSAPGGDAYDSPDGSPAWANVGLGAFPKRLLDLYGVLDETGAPTVPNVLRDCQGDRCAYYIRWQGTTVAAPHAVGVAALFVARSGQSDPRHPGKRLDAARTERGLYRSATPQACPQPRTYTYVLVNDDGTRPTFDAICAGGQSKNGFYGRGIVNAYLAAGGSRQG